MNELCPDARFDTILLVRSVRRGWLRGGVLREDRSAVFETRRGVHDLAGLRFGETELTRHSIDAAWAAELSFAEAELTVLFAKLIANLLLRLDAVRGLDGVEVLETINHDEREEHGAGGGEHTHLARAHWIGGFNETRIVEAMGEENFRRADTATTHGLLR